MKKVFVLLMSFVAMMVASTGLRAQDFTLSLHPGWNWIGYPYLESSDLETVLGDFEPMTGDLFMSQIEFTEYDGEEWFGDDIIVEPGRGYMYYSKRTEAVDLVLHAPVSQFTVITATPTDITATSAVVGGTVTVPEGSHVFLRGVCWGTEPNPDIDGNHTSEEPGVGVFNSTLEGLTLVTTYYVRAYAVTDFGLAYGEELSFATLYPGSLNGLFSVSENSQIRFSQGNLQYQASTNTWRFAENQWDCVGDENTNISPTYEGWIDLFGWGTSGYNHGAVCYQPWSTSGTDTDYYVYGSDGFDLDDQTGQADWGYNAISNGGNRENSGWYTLSYDEWNHLLFGRSTDSGIRFAKANVNNVNGVILLPDDWSADFYSLNNANSNRPGGFSDNTISMTQWSILEQNGAVFIPNAGVRIETSCDIWVGVGNYWTSTHSDGYCAPYAAYFLAVSADENFRLESHFRSYGRSVRLARSVQTITYGINVTPNPAEGGTVTGAGEHAWGETCTLMTTPNEGWIFVNWTENGEVVSTDASYTFTVQADRTLVANFSHAYVDLGLPSGTLWATCNIGADSPEDYGDYFAWGETQPKESFGWSTYQYCNGSSNTLTKYCNYSYYGYNGFTDNLTILLTEDDAATSNWGSAWRMPTEEEWDELLNSTTYTWTTQNGVNGWLFTASNGNSLFLPAAGWFGSSSLQDAGNYGGYLSSTLFTGNPNNAWSFYFGSNNYSTSPKYRSTGSSIRAVRSSAQN